MVLVTTSASLTLADHALGLPDGRGYELVSPVRKNGLAPYAAMPSPNGTAVDYQARGALAGASSGALNLYQAARTASGWQTTPVTPAPTTPLGSLEEQAPVWISQDLSKAIFTTPASYTPGDQDNGSLSLYEQTSEGLTWVSQGTQGASEPNQATFDAATPDGNHIIFSTSSSLLPAAAGLSTETIPEAEYLYERNIPLGQTSLLSLDATSQPVGYASTTLSEGYTLGFCCLAVASIEGFFPGQAITVGSGPSAETIRITRVLIIEGGVPVLEMGNPGLFNAFPVGTSVVHVSEGAILGDGGHLASGLPPAGEFLPADAGSGSTTNAISSDESKVFFEAPNPSAGEPVGLYMRQNNSTTTKIAGATPDGTTLSGASKEESVTFGAARYQGAATDGSLVFFTADEGLAGATHGREVYEFNTTSNAIGGVAPLSVRPVSAGLGGDQAPATTVISGEFGELTVGSTAGFHAGEEILFAPYAVSGGRQVSGETVIIATVNSPTEITVTEKVAGLNSLGKIPAGTEVHGVHPASLVAVANDGSRVFFESDGVLAANKNAQNATAVAAQPNLYGFDTSTSETTFIGTLVGSDVSSESHPAGLAGEPDISRPAVPIPDGGVLVFASAANLTGENPWQEYTEIYRYAVAGNTLSCVSCTAPGVKPAGNATFGETAGGTYDPPGLTSPMSEDGSMVFFQTPDSLVPRDTNGGSPLSAKFGTPTSTDVYEWEEGKVSLISSGTASTPAVLQGTTPSGDDALFTTTAQLVPSQSDGGYENVVDARVGGGFPEAAAAPSCVGESCRAVFGSAPVLPPPASASPQGAGNVPSAVASPHKPKPLVCGRGRVKRRVKGRVVCAKRARKTVRASRRAGGTARTTGRP